MKKMVAGMIIGLFLMQTTNAQDSEGGGFDKSKLFVGGNLGLAFGYATIINIAPEVGYRFSPMFAAGVGLNYSYYNYQEGYYLPYKETYAGMSIFGRFYPVQQFFIQAQPGLNYVWGSGYLPPFYNEYTKVNQFVPSLLVGGGAAIPTGANGALTISVMYDVIQNYYSPYYHQAVYGIGYTMGF
jgi:hypothetical protein